MILRLNEQEVVDGICVYVADSMEGNPEQVDVKELNYHKDGEFTAKAKYGPYKKDLDTEDIVEGISNFLEIYHSFNPDVMNVQLNFTEGEGIWAEVSVNE